MGDSEQILQKIFPAMLPRTVVESPTLEVFKKHLDLNLGDVVWWFRDYSGGAGFTVGLMILMVTSSRDGSMILWRSGTEADWDQGCLFTCCIFFPFLLLALGWSVHWENSVHRNYIKFLVLLLSRSKFQQPFQNTTETYGNPSSQVYTDGLPATLFKYHLRWTKH